MTMTRIIGALAAGTLAACVISACSGATATGTQCDPDNGGLTLPEGFCAVVVADEIGAARHLTVAPNGDVFVALRDGGVAALRDTTEDGRADIVRRFGDEGGTGIALWNGFLYFGTTDAVIRWPLPEGSLEPSGPAEVVAGSLLDRRQHSAKSIAIHADTLWVNIGAPSNACQQEGRTPGSPGMDPCPLLDESGGIWAFNASRTGQTQADGTRYATGLRNVVALAADHASGQLYGVQHGRDQLSQLWPDLYTEEESAELPAEEFVEIDAGDDFGWPYCYYDWQTDRKVLAPEYGGDGEIVGRCEDKEDPVIAFPGHWAPNGLVFYTGADLFPERYHDGAFIAFHGSWNRAPLPQQGYNVVFVPFRNGSPTGEYETFADGFAGGERSPGAARHRPSGVAVGPDGSLFISDDEGGRIWRVSYSGG